MTKSSKGLLHNPDYYFIGLMVSLLTFGIVMVYDSTVVYSYNVFGGKYHFLLLQSGWVTIGLAMAIVISFLDYRLFSRISLAVLGGSIILLLLVFVPGLGVDVYGAKRWISLGSFTLQPSEIAKLALVLYLSAWLSADRLKKRTLSPSSEHQLLSFLILVGVLISLVLAQPNFSTSLILAGIGGSIYFVSGAPKTHFAVLLLAIISFGVIFVTSSPYRTARLQTYLSPESANVLEEGYHIQQIKIALGSGGLFGKGLGQSRQKYEYLPEVCSDSIFAIVGEELGFVGAAALILAFLGLLYRGFMVAAKSCDDFGKFLAVGITSWFALQIFINLSAMVGVIPLTGVTLPFISCGGSAAIVTLIAAGVLVSVSRKTVRGK